MEAITLRKVARGEGIVSMAESGADHRSYVLGLLDAVVLLTPHTSIDYDAIIRSAPLVIDTHSGLKPREAPNVVNIWIPATAAPVPGVPRP